MGRSCGPFFSRRIWRNCWRRRHRPGGFFGHCAGLWRLNGRCPSRSRRRSRRRVFASLGPSLSLTKFLCRVGCFRGQGVRGTEAFETRARRGDSIVPGDYRTAGCATLTRPTAAVVGRKRRSRHPPFVTKAGHWRMTLRSSALRQISLAVAAMSSGRKKGQARRPGQTAFTRLTIRGMRQSSAVN